MEIHTTARRFEMTPGLRRHLEEKLARVERYLNRLPDVRVVMTVEKHRHLAEVSAAGDGLEFMGRGVSDDMYTSVDLAIEKILTQVKRHKDRTRRRRSKLDRAELEARIDVLRPSTDEEGAPELIESERQEVISLSVTEAVSRLEEAGTGCVVFSHPGTGRIQVLYRRPDGQLGLVETSEGDTSPASTGEGDEG